MSIGNFRLGFQMELNPITFPFSIKVLSSSPKYTIPFSVVFSLSHRRASFRCQTPLGLSQFGSRRLVLNDLGVSTFR
ncbi:hypothetical protein DERF_007209 [Dermatophagoides farinae]|uniref:Uncharacterized protein n=1 Tax=Dermatophagoides farinae TaxID=6954 RepID=A0A922HXG8_DERFA|nr:hypothetical protein DERF_007209 [Dermatophagoides farinae]